MVSFLKKLVLVQFNTVLVQTSISSASVNVGGGGSKQKFSKELLKRIKGFTIGLKQS